MPGKFPDYNDDGTVDVLDIGLAPDDRKQEVADIVSGHGGITQEESQKLMRRKESSDIQLNPLPSLPSISNVGSVPFTGTVSHIPGGFQPLPQIAGSKKKLYQLSQFHGGINQKSSPRDISDVECQEAKNVSFSQIGRIKLLGDCANTEAIGADISADNIDENFPGYGLFQFTAPADQDGNVGEEVITCVANGSAVDVYSAGGGQDANFITTVGATDNTTVAQIYYAAGNGLYVADSNLDHSGSNRCKIYVNRTDFNQTITTKGWSAVTSTPLITSPKFINSGLDGDISAAANTKVTLEWVDDGAPDDASGEDGAAAVHIGSTGDGNWNNNYYFYISWIFDGGVETGLTPLVLNGDTAPPFTNETLSFNFSIKNVDSGGTSSTNYMGGDIRIEGARIYFKESGTSERWLLAEVSLIDGVRGALDSTFTPWHEGATDIYNLETNIIFDAPPSVYSYSSLNGYYANEVYDKSGDTIADDTSGPAPLGVRYKTVAVGSGGIVFIGNVIFDNKHMPDSMMFSMPEKPGVFPKFNRFDSPSSDGSPITALAAYKDTILQFKQNGMYVINVSNPNQFYAQASFRDCGVFNPCQVFTTSFGVIFVNKNGCYIYDGQKVTSLTSGKFSWVDDSGIGEAASNAGTSSVPCIGYDPRSHSIIILKDIAHTSGSHNGWAYNMATQSWTEPDNIITNNTGNCHTNFIITNDGYLAIKRDDDGTLLNYNHVQPDRDQTIDYITKDLDFGMPSQTKKIFKVYVTYVSNDAQVPTLTYGADGAAPTTAVTGTFGNTSGAITTVAFTVGSGAPTGWTGIKSFSLRIAGATDHEFEIQDIAILYRARPIK